MTVAEDARSPACSTVPAPRERAAPVAAGFLALLVAAFLFEPLFLGAAPLSLDNRLFPPFVVHALPEEPPRAMNLVTTDINGFVMPEMLNQVRRLRQGELPLWNPYQNLGQPLLADMGFVTFYPTSLLFLGLPAFLAYSVAMALHYWLLGAGTLWFLRRRGYATLAALAGAAVAMFCGFLVVRLHLPHFVRTAAWFPWLLLALDRLEELPSPRRTAVAGLLVGLLLLAGVPQTAFLLLGAAGLRFLVRASRRRSLLRPLAGLAAATVLGGALAAVQLLPATELLGESWRSEGMEDSLRARKRLEGEAAVTGLLLPHFFGDPVQEVSVAHPPRPLEEFPTRRWLAPDVQQNFVENAVYVGIVPLVLAVLALGRPRGAEWWTAVLLVLLGLGLAGNWPGFALLGRAVPGFASGSPKRALVLTSFGLAFLAAAGLQRILRAAPRENAARGVRNVLAGAALACLAAGATGFLPFERWLLPGAAAGDRQWFRSVLVPDLFVLAGSGAALLLGAAAVHRGRRNTAALVLVAAASVDLLVFARSTNPPQPAAHQYDATPAIEWLQDHGVSEQHRFVSFAAENVLPGGLAQVFSLRTSQGIAALVDRETGELLRALEPRILAPEDPRWVHGIAELATLESPLLDLLGVRYVLTSKTGHDLLQERAALPGIRLVYTGIEEAVAIYERTTALPPAFLASGYRVIRDPGERLQFLGGPGFEPRTAVLEEGEAPATAPASGTVQYRRPSPERIELDVTCAGPGFVVVSESHFPGWRARIGTEAVPLRRVDHAFLGVSVPPGSHRVVLEYSSRAFWRGLGLAAAALATCAVLLFFPGRPANVKRHE